MARSDWSRTTRSHVVRREFQWSEPAINGFLILVLATAGVMIGVFAAFINIQNTMSLGVPWLFPFGISVGIITIVCLCLMSHLSSTEQLTPGVLIVFCFILFVIYLTGLIETGIQLFGAGNISQNCQNYVINAKVTGASVDTLAWLQQQSICQSWYAVFSFELIGTLMFLLMMFYGLQIGSGTFD